MNTSTLSIRIPSELERLLQSRADELGTSKSVTAKQLLLDALTSDELEKVTPSELRKIASHLERQSEQLDGLVDLALSAVDVFEDYRGGNHEGN